MFIADAEGKLVFYNEAAEPIFGRKFSDRYTQVLTPDSWTKLLHPTRIEGGPELSLEETPPGVAFLEKKPAHARLRITSLDGTEHEVSATAVPLLAGHDAFVGMVAIFWEEPGTNGS